MKKFSFFEVESQYAAKVISSLEGTRFRGRKVGVEIAQEDSKAAKPAHDKGDRRFGKEKRYEKKRRD
jgi:RNA recognition motif-containing protein